MTYARVVNEVGGIGPSTAGKSGQTITYTVTNAVNVPSMGVNDMNNSISKEYETLDRTNRKDL